MSKLTDTLRFSDAQEQFASARLWELFDGDRERLNIAHECMDRRARTDGERTAVIVAHADGHDESLSFAELADASSRFAHHFEALGVRPGDRIAIMLEPSLAFYAALFGAIKCGAIAVPLFTLFGPDGCGSTIALRDCSSPTPRRRRNATAWPASR